MILFFSQSTCTRKVICIRFLQDLLWFLDDRSSGLIWARKKKPLCLKFKVFLLRLNRRCIVSFGWHEWKLAQDSLISKLPSTLRIMKRPFIRNYILWFEILLGLDGPLYGVENYWKKSLTGWKIRYFSKWTEITNSLFNDNVDYWHWHSFCQNKFYK